MRQDAFRVLFPGTPLTLAQYRQAFTPSHATDDPPDAELQLELRLKPRDKLTPRTPPSPAMRAREPLVAPRRRLVGDHVRLTTRLTSALKHYFPHVRHWVHAKDTTIFCDFLAQWPTLNAAQLARRSTLERFFRAHHGRDADVIDPRRQALKSATPLTTEAGVIAPTALLVQALVSPLRVPLHASDDCDHAMAPRAQSHPDCPLLNSLPGAGAVLAPRLLAAVGEQRDRYPAADELHKYAGIAPVTERSGNNTWVHGRRQCPTFLRHTFVEWAAESIRHSCWACAYSQQPRNQGQSPQTAVRALAFQWLRILCRWWHNRTLDDESVSLQALNRRGAPLLHNLATLS